jgi:hypothetical protein
MPNRFEDAMTRPASSWEFDKSQRSPQDYASQLEALKQQLGPVPPGVMGASAPLIDLTGAPMTWLDAIKNPIEPPRGFELYHGIGAAPHPNIGKGLTRGWFSSNIEEEPYRSGSFGPNFLSAKFHDLPQPVAMAPRRYYFKKVDPSIEYSPAWNDPKEVDERLKQLEHYLRGKDLGRYSDQPPTGEGEGYFGSPWEEAKIVQEHMATRGNRVLPIERTSLIRPGKEPLPLTSKIWSEIMSNRYKGIDPATPADPITDKAWVANILAKLKPVK